MIVRSQRYICPKKKVTKIERVERGFVVELPAEMFAGLGLGPGDEIVAEAADKVISLTAAEPEVERAVEIARRGAQKYLWNSKTHISPLVIVNHKSRPAEDHFLLGISDGHE